MASSGGDDKEWEILLSAEVESFLDHLYESGPASHQLVNQAIQDVPGRFVAALGGTLKLA